MNCRHCNKPLQKVQWADGDSWKSCPRCSTRNGSMHVFYRYPSYFGTTPDRATETRPEGPQSYCTVCRGNGDPDLSHAIHCDSITQ